MADQTARGTGRIYDLGYLPYDGERLGRRYAVRSLFIYSLRAVFGIGRSVISKVFPIGLALLALAPVTIQLGIAAVAPADVEFVTHADFLFPLVALVLVLFCAFAAPEIVSRDQRFRTITLYFSRTLSRVDYVSSNLAALAIGLLFVLIVPQVVLLLGTAVATDDVLGHLRDNLDLVPPIIGSSVVVSLFMASISLTIASLTPRRAFASGGVLAYFVIFSSLAGILAGVTTGTAQEYVLLIGPLAIMEGAVLWIFGEAPDVQSQLAMAGLNGGYYLLAVGAYTAVSLGILYRHFLRLPV